MQCALLLLIVLSWVTNSEAYVQNRTQSDSLVHWLNSVDTLDIYVNPSNTQGILTDDVNAIVAASLAQWNGNSRIFLRQNSTPSTNTDGLNEIYFSTDPSIFANGSMVVGVTQVYFKNTTGEILEADILINDGARFTTTKTDEKFLGNVISHEVGHLLGLGHSQVPASTMLYALTRGQSELADDDKAGAFSIYPTPGVTTKGSLNGKIVGGKSLSAVFGAQVQAISLKTGRIAGANFTDIDGSFSIGGLDRNDQYFIYTKPLSVVGLPSRYSNVRFDFCNSSKKYRGSFFQSCGASGEGYPQAIKLNSSSVSVGNVTIRCGLDVPVDYIQNKETTPAIFDLHSGVDSGVGNSFVGFFSSQDVEDEKVDYFKIGYSGINWDNIPAVGDLYIELKVLNQSFYSPFKANIAVKRSGTTTAVTPNYVQESDGSLNLETIVRVKINRNREFSSDNDLQISVRPESLESSNFPQGSNFLFFPAASYFEDSLYFYLVTASIVEKTGADTYTQVAYKNEVTTDNSSCPDASNTYALTNYSATGSSGSSKKKDDGLACGSVDLNGGPGNGPGGFFIGLIFSLILCSLTSSIIKQYKAKHYSKLA
jgi:hypothetical protein